jgi:predicted ATPase/DNA-binding SARP family transcriptional activator
VKVCLLGPLEVIDASGGIVTIPGARQRTLVALLALHAGRVVSADQLIDDLWDTALPRQPGNALQLVVSKARRAIGADLIETRPPGYRLAVAAGDVDAHRFEDLVLAGRAAVADRQPEAAIEYFDEALLLWRGNALAEFGDVRSAASAATRLDELRAATVEERFDALLEGGHDADLVPDLEAAIMRAPFRERLHGQLMLALYRSGRQADALRAYGEARRLLAEELGLEPGNELRRLETAILQQDDTLDRPTTASPVERPRPRPPTTPTNLRHPRASFVGRQGDIATVAELLQHDRIVTLVGAGGCGKTRLAVELGTHLFGDFPGGVWFVPFDTLTTGDGVTTAVADAIGVSGADAAGQADFDGMDAATRVRAVLAERTALVILDNCEHVIEDAARLADDLLASAPQLRLLVTSREALRVPGEVVWRVPPLAPADAVMLFAERAHAASPTLELTDDDRALVEAMCDRVDGLPLAIELTAARTSAFTVEQLAGRLEDRFRLLTSGARTALPRHQTLRAVTDWSYDLLFDEERAVFERLAVFAGGFDLDAAQDVCADDELEPLEVGDLVGRLVDKSLVVADGSGRFRLLLTLADYGRERLDDQAAAAVRDRHAAYYSRLAERSLLDSRGGEGRPQAYWLAWLDNELDNLRAAIAWSIERGDGSNAQLLAGCTGWYWWHMGRAHEGLRWLDEALACGPTTPPEVRARTAAWSAWLGVQVGDRAAAAARAAEAVELSETAGDNSALGLAWFVVSQIALLEGRVADAAECQDRAQRANASEPDLWHRGIAAMMGALAAILRGDTTTAERDALVAIDSLRAVGDVCQLVPILHEYGRTLQGAGRIEEAEAALREAHDVSEAFGLRGWQSASGTRLGELALLRGDHGAALDHYRQAADLARAVALPATEAAALQGLELADSAIRS